MIDSVDTSATVRLCVDPLASFFRHHFTTNSSASWIGAIGETLPIRDRSIDVVLALNVLDHCYRPRQVLREIHRVLKPAGRFVLGLDLYSPFQGVYRRLLEGLSRGDPPHPHSYTVRHIRKLAHRGGLDIRFILPYHNLGDFVAGQLDHVAYSTTKRWKRLLFFAVSSLEREVAEKGGFRIFMGQRLENLEDHGFGP